MSAEQPFDPNKPKRLSLDGGVENLDFRESAVAAPIVNALNRLRTDLADATPEDYDNILRNLPPPILEQMQIRLEEIKQNIDRHLKERAPQEK